MTIYFLPAVALPFGIMGIVMICGKLMRKVKHIQKTAACSVIGIAVLLTFCFQPMIYFNRTDAFLNKPRESLLVEYNTTSGISGEIRRSKLMFEEVDRGVVLASSQDINYWIPAWSNLKTLDYTQMDGDPSFRTSKSYLCWDYLNHNFDPVELKLAKVNYIYATIDSSLYQLAIENDESFQVTWNDGRSYLFKVNLNDVNIKTIDDARCQL